MGLGLEIGMLLEETLMKKLLFIYMHLFPHTHSPTQSGCAINVFPPSFLKETFIAAVAICRGLIWVVGGWTQNRLRGLGKWASGQGDWAGQVRKPLVGNWACVWKQDNFSIIENNFIGIFASFSLIPDGALLFRHLHF